MTTDTTAGAIPAGYRVTYAEDTAIGNGWWADLRDELGRVRESGGGHTQDAARAHLLERVARDPLADIDEPAAGTRLRTLGGHVAALLAEGYEVTFSAARGDRGGFFANLDKPGDPDAGSTGDGRTVAEALWTVSPLHSDDEPYPGLPVPDLATDVRTLGADMDDVMERLDALEDSQRTERALAWTIVGLVAEARPDGELARRLAAERTAAASQN